MEKDSKDGEEGFNFGCGLVCNADVPKEKCNFLLYFPLEKCNKKVYFRQEKC